MKKIITLMLLASILTGCIDAPQVDNLIEATVKDKSENGYGGRYGYDYYITVEKNEQKITLEVDSEHYKMISKGVIVSGYYDEDGFLSNISFPKLSQKPIDKNKE